MLKSNITPEISEAVKSLKDSMSIRQIQKTVNKELDVNLTKYNVEAIIKGEYDGLMEAKSKFGEAMEESGLGKHDWNHGWLKVDGASIHIKNEAKFDQDEFIERTLEDIKKHAPNYKKIKHKKDKDGHLMIVDLADHHFGKYASIEETDNPYDIELATQRFQEGLEGVIAKAQGWKKDKILFVIGNDVLHIDNPKRTTTSGTPQDTDGMWFEAFNRAKMCYIEAIEKLQTIANVHVVHNPSNHDYMSGRFLAQTLQAWFHKNPNLTWDTGVKHRKYVKYGNALLGFNHGDGAKDKDLPLHMATEAAHLWAESVHRYIYMHHVHHKVAKDHPGVTIEYLRSASGTDSWHGKNGYISTPAIDAFIVSKKHGQIARLTHYFEKENGKEGVNLTDKK